MFNPQQELQKPLKQLSFKKIKVLISPPIMCCPTQYLSLSTPQFTAGYLNKHMEEAAPTKD